MLAPRLSALLGPIAAAAPSAAAPAARLRPAAALPAAPVVQSEPAAEPPAPAAAAGSSALAPSAQATPDNPASLPRPRGLQPPGAPATGAASPTPRPVHEPPPRPAERRSEKPRATATEAPATPARPARDARTLSPAGGLPLPPAAAASASRPAESSESAAARPLGTTAFLHQAPRRSVRTTLADPEPERAHPPLPRSRPAAMLPSDPGHLAAVAARLGLVEASAPASSAPASPAPVAKAAASKSATRAPPPAPRSNAPATAPTPARPVPRDEPPGEPPIAPRAAIDRKRAPSPEAAAPPVATERAILRPAGLGVETLPAAPPQVQPRVSVEIGSLTLVAHEAKGRGAATGERKTSLAPVARREARGHSIPRPGQP